MNNLLSIICKTQSLAKKIPCNFLSKLTVIQLNLQCTLLVIVSWTYSVLFEGFFSRGFLLISKANFNSLNSVFFSPKNYVIQKCPLIKILYLDFTKHSFKSGFINKPHPKSPIKNMFIQPWWLSGLEHVSYSIDTHSKGGVVE